MKTLTVSYHCFNSYRQRAKRADRHSPPDLRWRDHHLQEFSPGDQASRTCPDGPLWSVACGWIALLLSAPYVPKEPIMVLKI